MPQGVLPVVSPPNRRQVSWDHHARGLQWCELRSLGRTPCCNMEEGHILAVLRLRARRFCGGETLVALR